MTTDISPARSAEIWHSPVGTELPDFECQWQYNGEEDRGTERSGTYCGVKPSIKSEFMAHYCKEHLEAARAYMVKLDAQKAKGTRIVVMVKAPDYFADNNLHEVIAYMVEKRPRFGIAFGKTWDTMGRTDRNERVVVDTTWGHWGYFDRDGVMYKVNLMQRSYESASEQRAIAKLKAKGAI